jgi:hypothetical protein
MGSGTKRKNLKRTELGRGRGAINCPRRAQADVVLIGLSDSTARGTLVLRDDERIAIVTGLGRIVGWISGDSARLAECLDVGFGYEAVLTATPSGTVADIAMV